MKVGMDGSLLGAWAGRGCEPKSILDIGTGTGLISLMLAQRFREASVTGIDIQGPCIDQARDNVDASPFSTNVEIIETRLQDYQSHAYDLIVCNPPFFNRSSRSGAADRNIARHDDSLPFHELVSCSRNLLADSGLFSIIIPEDRASEFMALAEKEGLHLRRSVKVRGRIGGVVKRRLLEFSPLLPPEAPELSELAIEADIKQWTKEYENLLRDFYLAL